MEGEETLVYVANFGDDPYSVNLQTSFDTTLPSSLNVKITSSNSNNYVGIPLSITPVALKAGEALILGTK